jgi:ADP-heptose:LPS heptosyltransferase
LENQNKVAHIKTSRKIILVVYNFTLGDSIILIRVFNGFFNKLIGAEVHLLCHESVKNLYSTSLEGIKVHTFKRDYSRLWGVKRFNFSKVVFNFALLVSLFRISKFKRNVDYIFGPDWFTASNKWPSVVNPILSRLLMARNVRALLEMLYKKDISVDSLHYDQIQMCLKTIGFVFDDQLPLNLFDSKFATKPNLASTNTSEKTPLCIVLGAGDPLRDWTRIHHLWIIEQLNELGIPYTILDGSSNELSLKIKVQNIANSLFSIVNDTSWFHVAQATGNQVLCLAWMSSNIADQYIQPNLNTRVIRPKIVSKKIGTKQFEISENGIKNLDLQELISVIKSFHEELTM